MPAFPVNTLKRLTEYILEVNIPGNLQCSGEETIIISSMSVEKSDDREGVIKLIKYNGSVEFEAPVVVLMNSTISVPEHDLLRASEAASKLLQQMAEESGKDVEKWDQGKVDLIQTLVSVIKPMFVFTNPVDVRPYTALKFERWVKLRDTEVKIDRPIKGYLRTIKVVNVQ